MDVASLLIKVRCGRPGCDRSALLAAGHLEFIARECGVMAVTDANCVARMVEIDGWHFSVSPDHRLYGICGEDMAVADAAATRS